MLDQAEPSFIQPQTKFSDSIKRNKTFLETILLGNYDTPGQARITKAKPAQQKFVFCARKTTHFLTTCFSTCAIQLHNGTHWD